MKISKKRWCDKCDGLDTMRTTYILFRVKVRAISHCTKCGYHLNISKKLTEKQYREWKRDIEIIRSTWCTWWGR